MSFFRILKYDLIVGVISRKKEMIITFALFSFIFFNFWISAYQRFYFEVDSLFDMSGIPLSIGDIILNKMGGGLPPQYIEITSFVYSFPSLWLLVLLCPCYFTLNYLTEDMTKGGIQVIIRTQSRPYWWISKCFWNIIVVTIYYLIGYLTLSSWSLLAGIKLDFSINQSLFFSYNGYNLPISNLGVMEGIRSLIILPYSVCISFSFIQMMLSLFIKPNYAFLTTCFFLILGSFYPHYAVLANFAMPLRNESVGIYTFSTAYGFVFSSIICILSAIVGMFAFCHRDICPTKGM